MITELALAAAGAMGLRALAHRAIAHGLRAPRLHHGQEPADPGVAPEAISEVRIAGARGRQLFGWLVMPSRAARRPAPAVLVMHGWGANAAHMWPLVAPLHAADFAVLLIDARGHGRSDDETFTSLPRFAEDISAGLAWLRAQNSIDGDRLALLGHSVGAGAAMLHAAEHGDVAAVVSLSAFDHPRNMMLRFMVDKRVPYPVLGWYVLRHVQRVIGASFDAIAPVNTLPRIRCPVLLVHGRDDTTVPVQDAHHLKAVAPTAKLLLIDGDHDLRDGLARHRDALVVFLRDAFAGAVGPDPASQIVAVPETPNPAPQAPPEHARCANPDH